MGDIQQSLVRGSSNIQPGVCQRFLIQGPVRNLSGSLLLSAPPYKLLAVDSFYVSTGDGSYWQPFLI